MLFLVKVFDLDNMEIIVVGFNLWISVFLWIFIWCLISVVFEVFVFKKIFKKVVIFNVIYYGLKNEMININVVI